MTGQQMRVLRISHSAVVSAWRQRERELRRIGVEARLLCARAWDEGGTAVEFHANGDDFAQSVRTLGSHPNLFLYDPRPLWRALGESWDLLDIHEEPCSVAAAEILLLRAVRRVRTPFVLYSAQNIPKRYPPPFRWTERWALRRAGGVSVCNGEAGRILQRKGLRGIVAEIPLGVDVDQFRPQERSAPAGGLRIGYVGRLAPHKGVPILVEALGKLPECTLILVGSGPSAGSLREQASRLGVLDRVDFRGHTEGADLAAAYRDFDVLAIPSLTTPGWVEQFGRVVVEAMASGVPVIASRSGALPDVVDGCGVLVEPGDVGAWADAVAALAADPRRWEELRDAGLRRAGQFSWPSVAGDMRRLYADVLSGRSAAEAPPGEVEVVAVAYGSAELLRRALTPLAGRFPITVVDNSSAVETRRLADDLGARYLDPGRNLGFAAGVNYAFANRQCPAADVLLVNPDALISADAVDRLRAKLAADPGLGCIAPAQVDTDERPARVSWPFPSPLRAWSDAAGLGRLRSRRGFVIGAVLLIRQQALADVGGFDERFFLYAEETDWQRRATNAGWRVAEAPEVLAMHEGAGTGGDAARREGYFHASHERYIRKHYGTAGWQVYRAGAIAGAGARSVLGDAERRAAARRRLRLYWRGPVRGSAPTP